jgi:hypothetical protein
VLPDDVGRRPDLEVVEFVVVRHEVGVPEHGRVVRGRVWMTAA